MWREVQCLILVLSTVALSSGNHIDNSWRNSPQRDEGNCLCVDWWLCGDNENVITDGDGLLEPKSLVTNVTPECNSCSKCQNGYKCCRVAPNVGPSWDNCGVNLYDDEAESRIMYLDRRIGQTRFAEFPWTLVLFKSRQKSNGEWQKYRFHAAASIIHPKVALTVAHKVQGVNHSLLTVRAGEWDVISSSEEISHQDRGVEQIIIHPGFNKVNVFNNIALLILDKPLQIAKNVVPICLPSPNLMYNPESCLAVGWGTNRFGEAGVYSTTLRKVQLPIVPDKKCEKKLRKAGVGPRFRLHDSFICAGGKLGEDTCLGDGGGPLMCLTDDDKYVQIGIVSWGVKCGNAYPAVYTKVSKFLDWIHPIIDKVQLELRESL